MVLLTGTRKCVTSALSRMALMDFLRRRFSFPKGSEGGRRPTWEKELGVSSGCEISHAFRSFVSFRFGTPVQETGK